MSGLLGNDDLYVANGCGAEHAGNDRLTCGRLLSSHATLSENSVSSTLDERVMPSGFGNFLAARKW